MLTRRSFLQSTPLLALASSVPLFVLRSMRAATPDKDGRVLVVVELDGGNDALNTVVPHADEDYAKLRPKLKHDPKRLLKLTNGVGLHPALKPLEKLLDAGRLAVVPGVGYPNPSRSHFTSMAIWQTGRLDTEELQGYGWLGRAMDPSADHLVSVGGEVPTALRGRRSSAIAFKKTEDLLLSNPVAARAGIGPEPSGDLTAFVRRQTVDAFTAADKLSRLTIDPGGPRYPDSELSGHLKQVARLLKADVGARVFYTKQSGYDTHSQQPFRHAGLLREFGNAVAAFFADLTESKLAERVTLLAFSEFGRTIKENASDGTDHGTAGAVFVIGPTVKGGLLGTMPSLTDLEKGEPEMTTDFRGVYAATLENWLSVPPDESIKGVPRPVLYAS
jgi:uncharacterized protein (DUF1501 family)